MASRILLVFLAVLLGLGLVEGILRYQDPNNLKTYWRHKVIPYRRAHPVYGHGLRPNTSGIQAQHEFRVHYKINSLGMRDREYTAQVPRGTYRILMIGDSYTEGVGVELHDGFVKRIERDLNGSPPHPGTKYEVINMGVTSFSPLLEYLYLKETLPHIAGNLLVLNLDPSDFSDDYFYERSLTSAPDGTPLRVNHQNTLPNYLSRNRHYLETLPPPPWRNIYLVRLFVWEYIRWTHDAWVNKRKGNILYDRVGWTRPGQEKNPAWWAQLDRTWGYIRRIRGLLGPRGIDFVLTFYPHGHMVHPQAWCKGRMRGHYKCGKVYGGGWMFKALRERSEKDGVTYWDLRDAFRRPDADKLYYDLDGHFTVRGNEVMASAIEKRLRPLLANRQGVR